MHEMRAETADGVMTVTIDRPAVRNALTLAMRNELCRLMSAAERDPHVRVVVLTAVDPVFSAGVDFKEVGLSTSSVKEVGLSTSSESTAERGVGRQDRNPGMVLRSMSTPVICAVNGACVSGALEIALSSSFIVASERARFADTHARLGVVASWGLTATLPRAIGVRKAREMSITGNFVDAEEALRLGLVNEVVPHDKLADRVAKLAADVADTSAVTEVLDLYRRGEGLSLAEAVALEADHVARRPRVDVADFAARGSATAKRAATR